MRQASIKIFLFLSFITIVILSSCKKKYPENKGIHLTNPGARILGEYFITEYSVNGVDSIPLLTSKFLNKDATEIQWAFSYLYHTYDISEQTNSSGDGTFRLVNDKKELEVVYVLSAPSRGYNIFLEQNSTWEILKLYQKKKKPTLKIKRDYNGKTYIIQFN